MSTIPYTNIPQLHERSPFNAKVGSTSTNLQKRRIMYIVGTALLTAAGLMLTILAIGNYSGQVQEYQRASSAPLLGVELKDVSYCKVQCSNPCSKFPSLYGDLCCDWSSLPGGGQVCAQMINKEGVCTCGIAAGSPGTPAPPAPGPAPAPVPVPVSKEPDVPMPSLYPTPAPVKNKGGFEPFPTMQWWPFPKMDFHPYPTMAWIPFQPIGIPPDATPCKRSCDHACGQTMINGETYCCEPNAHGGCGTTTVDGKCYCS